MKYQLIFKNSTQSCMDDARGWLSYPEAHVVVAQRQLTARGRQGRQWASPEGGLYCAMALRPDWPVQDVAKMTLLAAVAVCEALREVLGVEAQIKWPNDLLVDGKKVSGILTESKILGKTVEHVIVGIGVNVNTPIEELPQGAVSLKYITGREYDLKEFLDVVLERFGFWYEDAEKNGFTAMLNRWRALCGMLGQRVRVQAPQGQIEGIAVDLADDGGLLIKDDDSRIVKVVSGDVTQVRTC